MTRRKIPRRSRAADPKLKTATTIPVRQHSSSAGWPLVFGAWLVASVSTLGALFLSEVVQVPPCMLCWVQRIFMFPLVLILPLGLFPFDPKVARYALALAVPGALTAAFHLLLVAGVIPERIQPCTQGVPCSEDTFALFGVLSVPMLSALAFSAIVALAVLAVMRSPK